MAYTTIDDPSAHFTTTLYTGNGSDDRSITNSANAGDFKPDWLWIKERDQTRGHLLQDSTRGATKYLGSHTNSAENTNANGVQAFETNGFQLGTDTDVNLNTGTYVAWQWKANGGTTSSNTDGSITSTVQANTTAGFSIVKYGGNDTAGATIGHGLGVKPQRIFLKNISFNDSWMCFDETNGANNFTSLDVADGTNDAYSMWNDTAPTTSVFSVGSDSGGRWVNNTGDDYDMYH